MRDAVLEGPMVLPTPAETLIDQQARNRPTRSPARSRSCVKAEPIQTLPSAQPTVVVRAKVSASQPPGEDNSLSASLKWWTKYLVFPLTWALAYCLNKDHLMPALMGGTALRYIVALLFTALSS